MIGCPFAVDGDGELAGRPCGGHATHRLGVLSLCKTHHRRILGVVRDALDAGDLDLERIVREHVLDRLDRAAAPDA